MFPYIKEYACFFSLKAEYAYRKGLLLALNAKTMMNLRRRERNRSTVQYMHAYVYIVVILKASTQICMVLHWPQPERSTRCSLISQYDKLSHAERSRMYHPKTELIPVVALHAGTAPHGDSHIRTLSRSVIAIKHDTPDSKPGSRPQLLELNWGSSRCIIGAGWSLQSVFWS